MGNICKLIIKTVQEAACQLLQEIWYHVEYYCPVIHMYSICSDIDIEITKEVIEEKKLKTYNKEMNQC
ncbi:uncharacterized protein LOC143265706 isoform X2 [Megachile rotundata]|uniref:uncharacterized protein LOC143265706 isoform X2 n=1 Tax=Megachile rotundata TaxID=143995 RepID=UPI003FD02924